MKNLVGLVAGLMWISGCVVAKGFWSTLFAVIFPFWAWYLVVDYAFKFLPVP